MAYCPEDGTQMVCDDNVVSCVNYWCPKCQTDWLYDAEEGCYRVIPHNEGIPDSVHRIRTIE